MTKKDNYYLGIDLGTSNSCMAWGAIEGFSQTVKPEIVPTPMPGMSIAQHLVPSIVMYGENQTYPKELGTRTKEKLLLGTEVDLNNIIIKSAKLQMGQEKLKEAPWLTPQQVSSSILKFLKNSAEKKFGQPLTSVVIGVPACFNTDMWSATKGAAELAGFTTIHLIDEPKAALLDFMNEQERLSPESRVLDFSEPKTLCIFDPGGGTIDVSIVRVHQTPTKRRGRTVYEMHFEDLGLTREPFLGGDDFDKLLAVFLQKKFFEQTGIQIADITDEKHKAFVYGKLLEYAEAAKKNLTDEVTNLTFYQGYSEQEAIDKASVNITIGFLYRSNHFDYSLTYREYIEIISPLLGMGFSIDDHNNSQIRQKLAYQEEYTKSENVFMPVFDAILKAENKLGSIPSIDAVLVNGGMSKLHILRHRLKEFFGSHIPIIDTPSPDLSVAKGAAIRNYNIVHELEHTSNLLPDDISLETSYGFITLVSANTKYPTTTPIIPAGVEFRIPRDGIPYLDLPLWRGKAPNPTARLADRRITFEDKPIRPRKGDIVMMQINIDASRQLKLEAWLKNRPSVRFGVATAMS